MVTALVRFLKRFLILIPGLIIVYFAVADLVPFLHDQLSVSWAVAFLLAYVVSAYLLIPTAIRVLRSIFPARHIPLYSTTPDGFACDPINVGIVGTEKQVRRAMKQAGWHEADTRTPKTILRLVMSFVLKRPYSTAPFSNLYLLGRSQDLGFQLPLANDPSHRHHVRFWAASHTGNPRHLDHVSFWHRLHRSTAADKRTLWVGAASLDTGLGVIRHNAQITHMIHPDTNAERELIVRTLKKTRLVKKSRSEKIGNPYRLTNRVLTGYLHTDGTMKILEL
ncbi:MAG TPA: LssY C-terminal domain-containing protein [Verrucomicrobiae bacterium]|nr:LssY C-terminal domain-containing protein [Verrucomicrobiae bacterium]